MHTFWRISVEEWLKESLELDTKSLGSQRSRYHVWARCLTKKYLVAAKTIGINDTIIWQRRLLKELLTRSFQKWFDKLFHKIILKEKMNSIAGALKRYWNSIPLILKKLLQNGRKKSAEQTLKSILKKAWPALKFLTLEKYFQSIITYCYKNWASDMQCIKLQRKKLHFKFINKGTAIPTKTALNSLLLFCIFFWLTKYVLF